MSESSTGAPKRLPIDWQDSEFTDDDSIEKETRRIFDVCHGCRRCFNLCDSFPRLFDLIDQSESGELDSVKTDDFSSVVDACTLCDMCFMTKCPYVPPHEFNIDFPHLMLRHRVADFKKNKNSLGSKIITKTDRNGKIGCSVSSVANFVNNRKNTLTRVPMEKVLGIHRDAELPKFAKKTFEKQIKKNKPIINQNAPGYGRKVVIFPTCFVNYNSPDIGLSAEKVLALNGVSTSTVYPSCCGMPQLESGDIEAVAKYARKTSLDLLPWLDKGFRVVSFVPSCSLMMKSEWPLILPNDANVKRLSESTFDICEYMVDLSKNEGLLSGLKPLDGGITLHISCHSRAQNMGQKAAEMLRNIPETQIDVIERCSGHGGSWGVMKDNFELATKIGRPVVKKIENNQSEFISSECPLAGSHIAQGLESSQSEGSAPKHSFHPIELLSKSYS